LGEEAKTGVGAGKILGVGRFLPKFPQKTLKNDLEKNICISLWTPLF